MVEVNKETSSKSPSGKGRPRVNVDYAVLLRLRDVDKLGWSLGAKKYIELTGQFISGKTLERRYPIAKAQQATVAVYYRKVSPSPVEKPQLVYKRATASPRIVEINGKKWVMSKPEPIHTIGTPPSACPPDKK